jgi:putative integral membrane protein (TIGR02587 family)
MQRPTTIDMPRAAAPTAARPVTKSLQEYARGVAGGLLFSLPMLYTMEMWWAGFITHPLRVFVYVLATFGLLLGYNRYVGLRHDAGMTEVAIDSVEEMGIGLVIAAIFLWLLGRVTFEMTAGEIVGQIVTEGMVVAIGVSVGTAQLGGGDDDVGEGPEQDAGAAATGEVHAGEDFAGQVVIALCGAVLVGANVAPTEEILVLAVEISPWRLLGLALVSIALGALILFYSDFAGAQKYAPAGEVSKVVFGTVITYAIALVASAAILWFFGRFDGNAPAICLAQTVVLGVAATLGASAGRLLLQPSS